MPPAPQRRTPRVSACAEKWVPRCRGTRPRHSANQRTACTVDRSRIFVKPSSRPRRCRGVLKSGFASYERRRLWSNGENRRFERHHRERTRQRAVMLTAVQSLRLPWEQASLRWTTFNHTRASGARNQRSRGLLSHASSPVSFCMRESRSRTDSRFAPCCRARVA